MHLKLPVVLLSAFALAAPGAMAYGKDNKDKDKNKDKKEQKPDDRRDDRHDHDRDGKMTICHIPPGNSPARHTIRIGEAAWPAHDGHGDYRGSCHHGGPNHHRTFNERDTNNDDRLSFSEFGGDRATFDRLDRNNNRSLSRVEFYRR